MQRLFKIVGGRKLLKLSQKAALSCLCTRRVGSHCNCPEKHHAQASSTVALITLQSNFGGKREREILKLQSKSLGLAHSEPSSPWQIPRNVKGYVQNHKVDIRGQQLVGVWMDRRWKQRIRHHFIYGTDILITHGPLLSQGEIREKGTALSDGKPTNTFCGLDSMFYWMTKTRSNWRVKACFKSCKCQGKKKSLAFEKTHPRNAISTTFGIKKTIMKPFFLLSVGMNLSSTPLWRRTLLSVHLLARERSWTLWRKSASWWSEGDE